MSTMSEIHAPKGPARKAATGQPGKPRTDPRRESMNTLAKGLSVIRVFSRDRTALRLCDVANLTSLPPATARRCLMALEDLGYVVRHGSLFSLRPKVLELTAAYLNSMNLQSIASKRLQPLTKTTGHASGVCVLDGTDIVYVAYADVAAGIRLDVHLGSRFPATETSAGRVLLSDLSLSALKRHLRKPGTQLPNGRLPNRPDLLKAIQKCQRNAFATLEDELAAGIVSISVPIYDHEHRIIAALCSWNPAGQSSVAQLIKARLELLREVSDKITDDLSLDNSLSFRSRRHPFATREPEESA